VPVRARPLPNLPIVKVPSIDTGPAGGKEELDEINPVSEPTPVPSVPSSRFPAVSVAEPVCCRLPVPATPIRSAPSIVNVENPFRRASPCALLTVARSNELAWIEMPLSVNLPMYPGVSPMTRAGENELDQPSSSGPPEPKLMVPLRTMSRSALLPDRGIPTVGAPRFEKIAVEVAFGTPADHRAGSLHEPLVVPVQVVSAALTMPHATSAVSHGVARAVLRAMVPPRQATIDA